jgi:hypothetical protein
MPLMSNPYVSNVAFINNQIVLTVEVDEYAPSETVEISGYATQIGGALAVFNAIQSVPKPNPDGRTLMYVTAPPKGNFKKGLAVTVVLRAARVWTTVLGEERAEQGPPAQIPHTQSTGDAGSAQEGTTWNVLEQVTYAAPSSTENPLATHTGSEANFHGDA